MNLADYLAGYQHEPGDVPTPIVVTVNGRREVRSLSSILYAAPPPEPARRLQKRMAELIVCRVSASGQVTRDDLKAGGFAPAEIDLHFRHALRRANVARLGIDL